MEAPAALRSHSRSSEWERGVRRTHTSHTARYHRLIGTSAWGDTAVIPQILEHFPAALVTRFRFLRQRLHHYRADPGMDRWINLPRRDWLFVHDLVDDRRDVLPGKRFFSRHHFIQQHAQGENIAPSVDCPALHLFRRHIAWRTHNVRGLLHGAELQDFRGAEVGDFHRVISRQHDICRLDVAVYDVPLVRKLQRAARLLHDAQHARQRKRHAAIEMRLQTLAFHQLHRDVIQAVFFACVKHHDNVGMGQQTSRARFGLKSG